MIGNITSTESALSVRLSESRLSPIQDRNGPESGLNVSQFIPTQGDSTLDLSSGSWALIQDTSNASQSLTLVQIKESKLDELIARMTDLKTAVDGLSHFDQGSSDYKLISNAIDSIERSLSRFLGDSIVQKSATISVDSKGEISIRSFADFLSNTEIKGFDGQSIEIPKVEISNIDFLNAYHAPDGCPICMAQRSVAQNESQTGVATGSYDPALLESADTFSETAGTNTSPGSSSTATSASTGGDQDYVNPLIGDRTWNLTTGETVSYSYYDGSVAYGNYTASGQPDFPGSASPFNATQVAEMDAVYALWSNYAPFEFEKLVDNPSDNSVGDLRVAYMTNTALSSAQAFAYYPSSSFIGGDTYYNLNGVQHANGTPGDSLSNNLTFSEGYGRITALHEIGHSIGLSHPFAVNGVAESTVTGETLSGNGLTDDMRTTVMSYTNSSNNKIYYEDNGSVTNKQIYSSTPMIYDVAAVEFLYGSITDTNLGDTTYTITNHQQIQTIVDSGGTDTLDLSAVLHRSIIDLTPGSLSSVGYATEAEQEAYWATQGYSLAAMQSTITTSDLFTGEDNFGIAFSATIENIIGSEGDDQFTGNSVSNQITGNGGDDTIDGGSGGGTAIFNGNIAEYSIVDNGDGTYTVTDSISGRDGTDTISNIGLFEFADAKYNVSSATTFGDADYRGGSNGGGSSNVYYSAFNRIDFSSSIMAPHEISELKALIFNSVGDVSDLIEAALQSFVNQRSSMSTVLDRLGSTITLNNAELSTETSLNGEAVAASQSELNRIQASENALAIKQQMLNDLQSTMDLQQSPTANQVAHLLSA